MTDPYKGWNLIRIGAEIRKWTREIAAAEKLLENYQDAEWLLKNGIEGTKKVEKIAELQRTLSNARNTRTALETARTLRGGAALLSWPALLALLVILAAISAGAFMYSNWDKPSSEPVAAGPAMNRPTGASTGTLAPIGAPQPNPPAAGALTGLPDVSGKWKSGYDIVRDFTQSGNTVTWSVDYPWGSGTRHEEGTGTVSELSSGSARIEMNLTFTEADGTVHKDNYTGTVTVDSAGKATRIHWRNNDVSERVQE